MKSKIIVLMIFASRLLSCYAAEGRTEFPFGTALLFTKPLSGSASKRFGSGWTTATFVGKAGNTQSLFSSEFFNGREGAIFDDSLVRISPTGKYAVLSLLRSGIVDSGPEGKPFVDSRQYCPVLDTKTGCILSNNSGSLCEGEWNQKIDEWTVAPDDSDSTKAMIGYQFLHADALWKGYLSMRAISHATTLAGAVKSNLGVQNMVTCEPVSPRNVMAYQAIARQLTSEGARLEANLIAGNINKPIDAQDASKFSLIAAPKAFLYNEPNEKMKTNAYLIKGDRVKPLSREGTRWIMIEYLKASGITIKKWILAEALK